MAFVPDYRTTSSTSGAGVQAGAVDLGLRAYMLRVYNWMASGLVLTGIVAYGIAHSQLSMLFHQTVMMPNGTVAIRPTGLGILSMFAPLAFVLVLSFGINRLSRQTAQALFWAFSVAMGLSMTNLFFVYADLSIVRVFFITASTFAFMSLYGYTTKTDLTKFGSFLLMGLFGIIIASFVNIFTHSPGLYLITSVLGVLIFTGLTAYDTQRIKWNYGQMAYYQGTDGAAKQSVMDALQLYLTFINLFTFLLQLTGTRSNNN
jgi:FtsH-binding integral membrane protein